MSALLFFTAQAVAKDSFSHPLNRLPPMGSEDEHAIRRQMVGEKANKGRPALAVQLREKRSAPNEVETFDRG